MKRWSSDPFFIWFPLMGLEIIERFDTNPDSYCNYAFIQTFSPFLIIIIFSLTSWTIRNRRSLEALLLCFFFHNSFVFCNATGFWPPISCQCLKMIIMDFFSVLPLKARYYHQQLLNLCLQIVKTFLNEIADWRRLKWRVERRRREKRVWENVRQLMSRENLSVTVTSTFRLV